LVVFLDVSYRNCLIALHTHYLLGLGINWIGQRGSILHRKLLKLHFIQMTHTFDIRHLVVISVLHNLRMLFQVLFFINYRQVVTILTFTLLDYDFSGKMPAAFFDVLISVH
jgi:hypothetical protein